MLNVDFHEGTWIGNDEVVQDLSDHSKSEGCLNHTKGVAEKENLQKIESLQLLNRRHLYSVLSKAHLFSVNQLRNSFFIYCIDVSIK